MLFALILGIQVCHSQKLVLSKEIELKNNITGLSVDQYGQFYAADEDGNVFKYSKEPVLLNSYFPQKPSRIACLDASNTIRIFGFLKDLQEYVIIDRFLTLKKQPKIIHTNDYILSVGQSQTFRLWMINNSTFSLDNYDTSNESITISTPLFSILPDNSIFPLFIKEYQNNVYLVDSENGIYVFDIMGNYLKTIAFNHIKSAAFFDNKVYSLDTSNIVSWKNLYGPESGELTMDTSTIFTSIAVYEDNFYLSTENKILIFKLINKN